MSLVFSKVNIKKIYLFSNMVLGWSFMIKVLKNSRILNLNFSDFPRRDDAISRALLAVSMLTAFRFTRGIMQQSRGQNKRLIQIESGCGRRVEFSLGDNTWWDNGDCLPLIGDLDVVLEGPSSTLYHDANSLASTLSSKKNRCTQGF